MSKDVSMQVGLDLPRQVSLSGSGGDGTIEVEVTLAPSIQVREFPSTPVHVWNSEGWTVTPRHVALSLKGDAEDLASLGEEDVVVFAHIAPGTKETAEIGLSMSSDGLLRVLHPRMGTLEVVDLKPGTVSVSR